MEKKMKDQVEADEDEEEMAEEEYILEKKQEGRRGREKVNDGVEEKKYR